MSEPQSIEQVRNGIEKILKTLNLTRIVCVDDTYVVEPPVEVVMVAACSLEKTALKKAFPELEEPIPNDDDVLKEQFRRLWNKLDQTVRRDRAKSILAAEGFRDNAQTDDFRDASILSELIPEGMLMELSPKQWKERGGQLLEENAKQPTLFLFDQDLSKDGGLEEGGIMIISSLLAGKDPALICGLLTHTVTPETQPQKWMELSRTHNIDRDRFLVVPKRYLSKDPALFAQTLKFVALSPDFTILKQKSAKIIEKAASTAAGHIEEISIYDLDHIVFQVSADEGLWEPDMLFRLHALFHRLESRRLAHEGAELETIARRLRSVSQIPTLSAFVPASTTWQIQQKELYEPEEHLNKNHLPLELGDIFIRTNTESKKCYILLAQPCDLMVRSDGTRQPEVVHVPLAEVVSTRDQSPYAVEMECFGNNPNERWCVKLKQVHQVYVWLLDLCVFNDDGSATMLVGGEVPDGIRPTWKARYSILAKIIEGHLKRLELISPIEGEKQEVKQIKEKLRPLLGDLLNHYRFKGTLVEQNGHHGIAYNYRRVGRLSRARAFGLLMAYTGFLSRPAYDRSFR